MNVMILAAGLGSRLKPWTLYHPKALVEVGGKPMLARVIENLRAQGFDSITVNIHHFGDQILDFLTRFPGGEQIRVSDERGCLLDTGGGVVKASEIAFVEDSPLLVHNVDILSNADLGALVAAHLESGAEVTLLVSERDSSRRLVFDADGRLKGWLSLSDGKKRPADLEIKEGDRELAFSGIYVLEKSVTKKMRERYSSAPFPIMDFFLENLGKVNIRAFVSDDLRLIDIGKPETLRQARELFG